MGAEAPLILPDAKREPYEDRNRLMGYEPDTCILCNRCVRYTQEVMQCSALSLEGRGPEARIVPTWGKSWLDTECELCGGCLATCPTGAIYDKFLEGSGSRGARARAGEDDVHLLRGRLPGRPERRPRDEADRQGDLEAGVRPNDGNLCVKGRFAFNFVHHPDRLTEPLVRDENGEFQPTTWEHALQVAAEGLKEVMERHSPQAIGVLASARLTNEGLPDPEARPDRSQDPLRPLCEAT